MGNYVSRQKSGLTERELLIEISKAIKKGADSIMVKETTWYQRYKKAIMNR